MPSKRHRSDLNARKSLGVTFAMIVMSLLFPVFSIAQAPNKSLAEIRDSLFYDMQTVKNRDELKSYNIPYYLGTDLDSLPAIINRYYENEAYDSIFFYIEHCDLGNKLKKLVLSRTSLIDIYYKLYDCCCIFEKNETALQYGDEILDLIEDEPYKRYQILFELGYISDTKLNWRTKANHYYSLWEKLSSTHIVGSWEDYFFKREVVSAFYINSQNYGAALNLEFQTIQRIEEQLGTENHKYALSLNNIANAYSGIGDVKNAIIYGKKALELRLKLLNNDERVDSMMIARSAYNLAHSYHISDSLKNANKYLKMALVFSDPFSDVRLHSLIAATVLYRQNNDFDSAQNSLNEALTILDIMKENESLGEYWQEEIGVIREMGHIECENGNFKEAIDYYSRVIEIYERNNVAGAGKSSILDWVIYCYLNIGDEESATQFLENKYELIRTEIERSFVALPTKQRISMVSKLDSDFDLTLYYCSYIDNQQTSCIAYNMALMKKGLLLISEQEFIKFLMETQDDDLIEVYREYLECQKALQNNPDAELEFSLNEKSDKLNFRLLRELQEYGDYTKGMLIKWEDIKNSLTDGEIAIEFITPDHANENCEYVALIVKKDYESPRYITLSEKRLVKNILEEDLYHTEDLYNLIWKQLETELDGVTTIYISAESDLHNIAIEYALRPDGKIMHEHYNIYRLSSTRELARNKEKHKSYNAVLYGGLLYDLDINDLVTENKTNNVHRHCNRSLITSCDIGYRAGVNYLPGTKEEIEGISKLLQQYGFCVSLKEGKSGTEESFYALDGEDFSILQIATHGFFWSADKAKMHDYIEIMSRASNPEISDEEQAMLRSGLLFSGANIGLRGETLPDNIEDGILTAQELSNMNLGNVDLVVMSACQTGLGETTGEGVFGLQRGFKLAGANSLLMSLWKVDDEATCILMTEFYKNLLSGKTKQESLYLAQKVLRESPEYSDPEFWAAFILLDALN